MKEKLAVLFCVIFIPTIACAQNANFHLVDTGVTNHSKFGTGIEMRIEVQGARPNDIPDEALKQLCNHFDELVVSHVQANFEDLEPSFIGVRVISGGIVGSYVFEAFELDDGSCGEPIS